jgi:hypothetical protein
LNFSEHAHSILPDIDPQTYAPMSNPRGPLYPFRVFTPADPLGSPADPFRQSALAGAHRFQIYLPEYASEIVHEIEPAFAFEVWTVLDRKLADETAGSLLERYPHLDDFLIEPVYGLPTAPLAQILLAEALRCLRVPEHGDPSAAWIALRNLEHHADHLPILQASALPRRLKHAVESVAFGQAQSLSAYLPPLDPGTATVDDDRVCSLSQETLSYASRRREIVLLGLFDPRDGYVPELGLTPGEQEWLFDRIIRERRWAEWWLALPSHFPSDVLEVLRLEWALKWDWEAFHKTWPQEAVLDDTVV